MGVKLGPPVCCGLDILTLAPWLQLTKTLPNCPPEYPPASEVGLVCWLSPNLPGVI